MENRVTGFIEANTILAPGEKPVTVLALSRSFDTDEEGIRLVCAFLNGDNDNPSTNGEEERNDFTEE